MKPQPALGGPVQSVAYGGCLQGGRPSWMLLNGVGLAERKFRLAFCAKKGGIFVERGSAPCLLGFLQGRGARVCEKMTRTCVTVRVRVVVWGF